MYPHCNLEAQGDIYISYIYGKYLGTTPELLYGGLCCIRVPPADGHVLVVVFKQTNSTFSYVYCYLNIFVSVSNVSI